MERIQLIKTYSTLPLRWLDTACMKDVVDRVALEEPYFLLVPLEVEFEFTVIAPILTAYNPWGQETFQCFWLLMVVSC